MWKGGNMMLQTNVMTLVTRILELMWIWKLQGYRMFQIKGYLW